ncbi:MAG: hypothetical protein RLZZ511_577 [Cyanobacteriota bacterium]|jgi:hypothetical protein
MFSLPPDPDLLKQVLAPLLEDLQYWYNRSVQLLEGERLSFMSEDEQAAMLNRVLEAQRAVSATQSLLTATDGQAGVEMSLLMDWHKLVTECWAISMQQRTA